MVKWQIYNFPTGELVPVFFDSHREAAKHCNRDKQTVVSVCTTVEDAMYMGGMDDISCSHALDPKDCIYCNPEFRDAYYSTCPWCNEHNDGNWNPTWSVPWTPERAVKYIAAMRSECYNGPDHTTGAFTVDRARLFQLAQYYARMAYEEPSPNGDPAFVLCLCCNTPHEWTQEWKP